MRGDGRTHRPALKRHGSNASKSSTVLARGNAIRSFVSRGRRRWCPQRGLQQRV